MSKILPVIHVEDEEQAARNLEVALEAGADGVFLINHSINASDLAVIFQRIRQRFPEEWIGVNYLGLGTYTAPLLAGGASGLWFDFAPEKELEVPFPIFGGVAFKYQHSRLSLEAEVDLAIPVVDVLVTSGPATGEPPALEKVQRLHALAQGQPIGIASGLDAQNVAPFVPLVDYLLVATGISQSFTELDPEKVQEFVQVVRGCSDGPRPA